MHERDASSAEINIAWQEGWPTNQGKLWNQRKISVPKAEFLQYGMAWLAQSFIFSILTGQIMRLLRPRGLRPRNVHSSTLGLFYTPKIMFS
eukprot:913589-Pelagomonas_calceolata.AAC.2